MDIHLFDLVVGVIILLLGLKGILNGFFKELFGLIGIIGGIFVASRIGASIGNLLNDIIFHLNSRIPRLLSLGPHVPCIELPP